MAQRKEEEEAAEDGASKGRSAIHKFCSLNGDARREGASRVYRFLWARAGACYIGSLEWSRSIRL